MTFTELQSYSLYWGLVVAVIYMIIYIWNHRSNVVFQNTALIILTSQATIGGPFLCIKALIPADCTLSSAEKLYVIVGGIAVAWNAFVSLKKIVVRPKELIAA